MKFLNKFYNYMSALTYNFNSFHITMRALRSKKASDKAAKPVVMTETANATNATKTTTKTRKQPHLTRLQKEWSEWTDVDEITFKFAKNSVDNVTDRLDKVTVVVQPDGGFWVGATIAFDVEFPETYPYDPPKVTCLSHPIYHPHISFEGKVCLNILRDGWRPNLTVNEILFGLLVLFHSPDVNDPLPNNNIDPAYEAAALLKKDPEEFQDLVEKTLHGGYVDELENIYFPCLYV